MSRFVASVTVIAIVAVVLWQLARDETAPETAPLAAISTASPQPDVGDVPTPTSPPLPVLRPVPELVDIDGWMNTERTTLEAHFDTVTVIQFWTFGCFNCKNTLDNLRMLYDAYGDQGLEIVGIHAPQFAYEADPDNIARALVDLDVTWPVALDTNKKNFRAWQEGPRNFWPRTYVIDADGFIRFDHIGEGKYDELNAAVAQLLGRE